MAGDPALHTPRAPAASLVDPGARTAVFAALAPALEALACQAGTDPRLSPDARRLLRAITRTRPQHTLSTSGLAARASTPKARLPEALEELHTHGYLSRVAAIAAHLTAALPTPDAAPPPPPGPPQKLTAVTRGRGGAQPAPADVGPSAPSRS